MKANDPQCIQNLGSTAHFPRWAVAFKFGTPTVQTEVLPLREVRDEIKTWFSSDFWHHKVMLNERSEGIRIQNHLASQIEKQNSLKYLKTNKNRCRSISYLCSITSVGEAVQLSWDASTQDER